MSALRLGFWSSSAVLVIGIAYVVVLAIGMGLHGLGEPISDPVLAIMEVLTLLSAPPMVCLMAAIHERASANRQVYGLVALAFGTLFAGTTSAVHFVGLTASRQLGDGGIVWPSRAYAAELLAWDVFLGLALLFAAETFEHARDRPVRLAMLTCGALCLAGTIGPVIGNMRLQLIGVAGYALVLPVVALLLMRAFGHARMDSRG